MNTVGNKSGSKLYKRLAVMLISVAILFGLVFGYGIFKSIMIGRFLATLTNQVQTVATISAADTPWQANLQSVGSFTAVNGASLSAEVSGIVDSIHFESGADVQKGDLLLTLRANNDPAVLAQLQAQEKLAAITETRDEKQLAADAISQAQLDSDRAQLQSAQAQVAAQQALIAEKQIRAPFSGRLGIRLVDIGQYISPGTAVVTLAQLNPVFIDFYMPQQALAQLQPGQVVNVSVDAYPGQNFKGTITALGATLDSATRSIAVRATLDNSQLLLRPGMFGSINVAVGAPQKFITLPQAAITYNPYGDTVFVVHTGKDAKGNADLVAEQVFVTLGNTRGDQVQVLSGLAPGDQVVTAGALKLSNNTPVAINNAIEPSDSPNPTLPNE